MAPPSEPDPPEDHPPALRAAFLLDPGLVFLNHGSFGACPRPVFQAYQRWQRELEHNPVELLARRSAALLAEVRAEIGALCRVPADALVLVTNATVGVNTVARSLPLARGDEILLTDQEYGACDAMWELLCRRAGARVVRAEVPIPFDADRFLDLVAARLTPQTRLVHLSHVTSPGGIVLPVAGVCRVAQQRGVRVLVDGAHAPGQLELDLGALGADYYAGNCHKWLCAPKGSAFLHARPEHQGELDAVVLSWGYDRADADRAAYLGEGSFVRRHQWQGTRDLAAFLAVPAAIAFQRAHHWPAVRERCHALGVRTAERLGERFGLPPPCAPSDFVQMVALPVPPCDPIDLQRQLLERFRIEVAVTSLAGAPYVRASFQAYNGPADADALVEGLSALAAEPNGPFG